MELFTRIRARAILVALMMAMPVCAAEAGTIVETATAEAGDPGDYIISNTNRVFGATFTVASATELTSVGFGYGRYGGGTIFAAIVPVDPITGFPLADYDNLAATALVSTLINVPAVFDAALTGDVLAPLSYQLAPGTYAVVFGSGQFGATGVGPFTESDAIGDPQLFQSFFGSAWEDFGSDDIRLLLNGDPVPEPMTIALMLAGLLGVAFLARGRSASPSFA
jgi:hypothetical protein